jgi:hypothetical protein
LHWIAKLDLEAAACQTQMGAGQSGGSAIRVSDHDIGGTVMSASGPEAGVWVIAETTDPPTKFAKIVVTDDRGRYLLPDLQKANCSVWARGCGKVQSTPARRST